LAENTIGDEGVRMLCTNALIDEQCELIILSLDYCGLTDQWVGLLSETLQHGNCKLAIVGLSGNNFTEEGQSILRDVQETEICEARCLDLYGLT
jgi:Ran GTPase-activating protein (RanGAP) involved in mRNA processing and transport